MAGLWRKTLIYLGLVEDEDLDELDYDDAEPEESSTRAGARRASADDHSSRPQAVVRAMPTHAPAKFHLLNPGAFNDAQELGDKYREGYSVLLNLQSADDPLARRIVDFASGLAYGLGGSLQPVADRVYLLTPAGVQVSAEERRRFLEERGFFNQA